MDKVPTVSRVQRGQLACWVLRAGAYEAVVAEQGAQLLSFGRDGAAPIVWLSEQAEYRPGVSVRGGVPVCWPWFGDLARNPAAVRADWPQPDGAAAPAHGYARGLSWSVSPLDAVASAAAAPGVGTPRVAKPGLVTLDDAAPSVGLSFKLDPPSDAAAPRPAIAVELRLRLDTDGKLQLSLRNHNLGPRDVTLSQALHTYLAVRDVAQASVDGLDGRPYIDTLRDWQTVTQRGPVRFDGEVDRIYLDVPGQLAVHDPLAGRRIHLAIEGSRSAVVWNPHVAKAARLSQFAPDAWRGMLCVETARVMQDVLTLAPGQSHCMALSLWETPL